ncbi:MAG TPA: hypothetical protein VNO31_24950, partial [Umezawaea sp.]|nr:hypothetical protein [Umezawaea sp.]
MAVLVGVLGLLAGVGAAGAVLWGGYPVPVGQAVVAVVLNLGVGWSFIGVGLVAWARRPESRAGVLMALVGFAWFVRVVGAVAVPAAFVVGVATKTLYLAVLGHLLVAYPSGRLVTWPRRSLVVFGYLLTVPVNVLYLLVAGVGPPQNLVVIHAGVASSSAGFLVT